jgi:hypothetical protein
MEALLQDLRYAAGADRSSKAPRCRQTAISA